MSALVREVLVGLPIDVEYHLQWRLRPNATAVRILDQVVVRLRGAPTFVANPSEKRCVSVSVDMLLIGVCRLTGNGPWRAFWREKLDPNLYILPKSRDELLMFRASKIPSISGARGKNHDVIGAKSQ